MDEGKRDPREVRITMRDGTELAAAIHLPSQAERAPALVAISPYRIENDIVPEGPLFLWRETGPIGFYVARGYAFVRVDVRGTGRSGGTYGFFDKAEQQDYYDIVQWIAAQPWCTGKVGGIGQSYYAMVQWFMAAQQPPALACIAPYDGMIDLYRSVGYPGGIEGEFWALWWNIVRTINLQPASRAVAREISYDLPLEVKRHPTYDKFWQERTVQVERIDVPVFSIGLWSKLDLHLTGNISGYLGAQGTKKLLITGASNLFSAVAEFAKPETHERLLLPFYERYLKGHASAYEQRPNVEYFVRGANVYKSAEFWPPSGIRYEYLYLRKGPSGSVSSLNDGGLSLRPPRAGEGSVTYSYPDPGWILGVVGFGPNGAFDPARRVLTFTSAPLIEDVEIVGPIKLRLFASSSASDTDFFVKISEQLSQTPDQRARDINPVAEIISKGWLRASHRALDPRRSSENEPVHLHSDPSEIRPGEIMMVDIALRPAAFLIRKGSRIRLEIANGDSPITDTIFTHMYTPSKLGADTIYHDEQASSVMSFPVITGKLPPE